MLFFQLKTYVAVGANFFLELHILHVNPLLTFDKLNDQEIEIGSDFVDFMKNKFAVYSQHLVSSEVAISIMQRSLNIL